MRERRVVKDVLWGLAFAGAVAMGLRLYYGLGATTNLDDDVPWGLWKILNMVAGVALSTGGFTLGLLVYVLKLERFRPLVKPAILIAFLGYGSSCFALFLDIGLPQRIWHPLVMWNERSFLFEVAWCVMLYFTVTVIELSPTVLERFRLEKLAHALHKIAPVVVIVGIALSSLHHSSLGSLFLVTPQRLHPLWFSPRLPFFFIMSAAATGMMVLVLAKMLYARWYDPATVFPVIDGSGAAPAEPPHLPMLRQLASIAAAILAAYLVLKVVDLYATGASAFLAAWTWESWLYVVELVLMAAAVVLMIVPATRRTPGGIGLAAGLTSLGLVLNRLDAGIFGYFRDAGTTYFPSLAEWALSLGIVAAAGLVFLKLSESTAIFDERWVERDADAHRFSAVFDSVSRVWQTSAGGFRRVSFIALIAMPVALVAMYPPFRSRHPRFAQVPMGLDGQRTTLRIVGVQQELAVVFNHKAHEQRNGGTASCVNCHHLSAPGDNATACVHCHQRMESSTRIFDHTRHLEEVARSAGLGGAVPSNHACEACHQANRARSAATARGCEDCHARRPAEGTLVRADGHDMRSATSPAERHAWAMAPGYRAVMHQACIGCHERAATAGGRGSQLISEHLTQCTTCHQGLEKRAARPRTTLARAP